MKRFYKKHIVKVNILNQVFEIQKYDRDPNYDGNLHESSFSGLFDIDGISCLSSDKRSN
jgi:hypothetical protein